MAYKFIIIGLSSLLVACKTLDVEQDINALIVVPDAQSRTELVSVVSGALDNAEVTLADDALVHSSRLIITRKQHQSIENGELLGRSYELPEHFNLVLNQGRCMLVRQKTAERWLLKQTRCVVNDAG